MTETKDDEQKEKTEDESPIDRVWDGILERKEFNQLREEIPDIFKALAEEFIKNQSVEVRTRIKHILKGLMAVISTDTRRKNDGNKKPPNTSSVMARSARLGNSEDEAFGDIV